MRLFTKEEQTRLNRLIAFVFGFLALVALLVYESDAAEFETHGECVAHFLFGHDYCMSACDIHNPYSDKDRTVCYAVCDDDYQRDYKRFCEKLDKLN